MKPNEHPTQAQLVDFVLRREFSLDENLIQEIESHLSVCELCREKHIQYKERYDLFHASNNAEDHFRKLKSDYRKEKRNRKLWMSAAAAVFVFFLSYGTAYYFINRNFDHSDTGLAIFSDDYQFAQKTTVYRDGKTKEDPGMTLFKEGVLKMFDAKTSVLGLFPDYDGIKIDEADRLFLRADSSTVNIYLKKKIGDYRDKIQAIRAKKEIKK